MSTSMKGPLVRLPSGRVCGGELTASGNVTPHKWNCDCVRCAPPQGAFRKDGDRPAGSWSLSIAENGSTWIEGPRIGGNGVFPNEGIVCLNDQCATYADAKLIAAAPDLVEALRAVREILDRGNYVSGVAIVDAALAKAGL